MKRLLLSILSAASLLSFQKANASSEEHVVVIIKPGSCSETTRPNRSHASVPIEVHYDGPLSAIIVSFNSYLGDVETTIMNLLSGEAIEMPINAYNSPSLIPLPSIPGWYIIRFRLPSGIEYYGEFML